MTTRRTLLRLAPLAAAGVLASSFAKPSLAAPSADLWPLWQKHDPNSRTKVDHGAWTAFIQRYRRLGSDGIARVDYAAARQARAELQAYLDRLAAVPVSRLNRDEQFAYWVNLYNALTVATILAHYPVDSIRDIDISSGFFADGPWGAELITVEGQAITLDDIEHRILRPIWRDPRIHYVVNCASIGCPNLPETALTAANKEQLMDAGARAYVNHPRGAQVSGGRLRVSSIYDWFEEDFGGSDAGVIAHLKRYAQQPLAGQLQGIRSISGDDYDWSLNDLGS